MAFKEVLFSTVSPYSEIIYPFVYLSFFSLSLIALYSDRWRKVFLIVLFTGVLTSGLLTIKLSPYINLNKYTNPSADSFTYFELRAVDSTGKETRVDDRASLGYSAGTSSGYFLNSSNNRSRIISLLALENIENLRNEIENEWRIDMLSFPPPARQYRWNSSINKKYGEFETVRITRVKVFFKENSAEVKKKREKTVYELGVADNRTE